MAPTSNLQQVGRSPQDRPLYSGWISWFIILPITVIGIIYSIQFIRNRYFKNAGVGGLNVGHTAIRINNVVYGYYPTDENGNNMYDKSDLFGSKGKMHIDSISAFNGIYAGQEVTYYQLNLTPDQGKKLKEILEDAAKNPGKYSLLGNNCTSVAVHSLYEAGVPLKAYSKFQAIQNMSGVLMSPNDLKVKLNLNKTFVTRIVKFVVGQ